MRRSFLNLYAKGYTAIRRHATGLAGDGKQGVRDNQCLHPITKELTMRQLHSLFLLPLLTSIPASFAADEVGLVELMGSMQIFAHKLQLSLDHGNQNLAGFYAHELEEVIEATMEVADYDGFPIGSLTGAMLLPGFEQVEAAITANDMATASSRFDVLVTACNACHLATEHGYIVISRNALNPYLQSFETDSRK